MPASWEFPGSSWWLGLRTSTADGMGSIPGQGTKFPQVMWHSQIHTYTHTHIYTYTYTYMYIYRLKRKTEREVINFHSQDSGRPGMIS